MIKGEFDITVNQGAAWGQDFQFFQADGTPLDLTGAELFAQIKNTRSLDAEPVASMTITVTDPANGWVRVTLTPTESRKVIQAGFWDLLKDPSGERNMLLRGKVIANLGVTNV